MENTRVYQIEGMTIQIPIYLDEPTGMYIEDYPDFVANPIFTPAGHQIMFAGEDACQLAEEATPGGCPDCGCCRHYQAAAEHTWFGICRHPEKRQPISETPA